MRLSGLVCSVALLAAACGGDDEPIPEHVVVVDDGIEVRDPWVRPTPASASEAAIYLEVENLDAPSDVLLGGRLGGCVTVQAHQTTVDDNGVAVMSAVAADQLVLERDVPLVLEPNGLHLMCAGLSEPFEQGDDVELTLVFEHHAPLTVQMAVAQR